MINSKNSQKIMVWCVESVIGAAFGLAEKIGDKLNRQYLKSHIEELNPEISGKQVSQMFADLTRRRYLEVGDGDSVKLSDKARIKIIEQICENRRDNKLRLISFDIPETMRRNRNSFRKAIKRMGFKQVQKSLWVTDKNTGDLVDCAAREYKVSDYIAYFIAEKSNIDRHIAKVLK